MDSFEKESLEDFINSLEQGDIIMHHAHGFISETIRTLENSNHNHCSMYDKDGYVYESVTGGVCRKKLSESINTQKTSFLSAYRLNNLPKEKNILSEIVEKQHQSDVYAYSQIVLLAMILLKKKMGLDQSKTKSFTEKFLIYTANAITNLFDPNNKNEICSELIYRVYEEAAIKTNNPNFHIIVNADEFIIPPHTNKKDFAKIAKAIFAKSKSVQFNINDLKKLKKESSPISFEEMEKATSNYLKNIRRTTYVTPKPSLRKSATTNKLLIRRRDYNANIVRRKLKTWEDNIRYFERISPETAKILKNVNVHNFITPADISKNCLNRKLIANYKTGKYFESSCNVCKI